ncbi:ATP-binding protein [Ureaplasma diversum]|uniref:ATP-binding protein n=1 Tax=Ureaplasma diversum TaxID=42094 RepID=UPI000A68EBBD|nr:ATP-binding protein [Ureaplasma diversum]
MNLIEYLNKSTNHEKLLKLEKDNLDWLKTVVAFSNTRGGKIIFGINDNDKCVGLTNAKKDAESISEFIKTKLEPLPLCELTIHSESSKEFIVLTVYSGNETPYYFSDSKNKIVYVRKGNESVVATNSQYKALILKGLNKTFDNLSTNINFNDVSFGLLKTVYYQKTRKELEEVDFTSFLLVDKNNNLTNAGALFADGQLVYQSRIFATRWKGLNKLNNKLEAYDDKEYQGNLLYLLEKGEDFINSNSVKMWRKANHQRIEYPDYPELAVREALTNALIHRDYSEIGSEIHIDMYDDRLEIYSPGGMVDGSIIQNTNVYDVASKRRNPIIADVFNRMNLMERRGSGLKKILDSYVAQINYRNELEPEFKSSDSSFYIILKNLNYENNKRVAINDADNTKRMAINDDIGDKTAAINQKNGDKSEEWR